jgi:hypothetical protein
MIKKLVAMASVVLLGIGLTGCGGGSTGTGETPGTDDTNAQDTYAVGETFTYKEAEITVLAVERNYVDEGMYRPADEGMEYVKIDVRIVSGTGDDIQGNPFNWNVVGSDNVRRQSLDNCDMEIALCGGEIQPGDVITGSVVFEVPVGEQIEILYQEPLQPIIHITT